MAPLSFASQDWGIVLRVMRWLGIQWRRVQRNESFSIGNEHFVVSARDYGLLVSLFLVDSFGTVGCSLDRRVLLGAPE